MARHTRDRFRIPTPHDTEHDDHSLQHPHSPEQIQIGNPLESTWRQSMSNYWLLTSAWMRITCSCHFAGAIAIGFLFFAWSRSELLATTAFGWARTPCAPIAPTGIVVSVAGALTRSIGVTHACLFFRQQHLNIAGVRRICSTRKFETFFQITTVRGRTIVQPRSPWAHFLYFGTCLSIAFFEVHFAAIAWHSAVLWSRIIAMTTSESRSSTTNSWTFAPCAPRAPIAIDRWHFGFGTRRQML